MEQQRIGSKSQPQEVPVVPAAAVDPAYIPGLTSPVPAEPEETEVDEAVSVEAEAAEEPEAEADPEQGSDSDGPGDPDDPDGPVFEASDRRASITADHSGVRLRLDDQAAEFRWDEIGAVETESPRFGKRFTITVHTPDRRWYPIEIEAKSRSLFKEWEDQLDAVLDAYFEEGTDEAEAEAEAEEEASAEESTP